MVGKLCIPLSVTWTCIGTCGYTLHRHREALRSDPASAPAADPLNDGYMSVIHSHFDSPRTSPSADKIASDPAPSGLRGSSR